MIGFGIEVYIYQLMYIVFVGFEVYLIIVSLFDGFLQISVECYLCFDFFCFCFGKVYFMYFVGDFCVGLNQFDYCFVQCYMLFFCCFYCFCVFCIIIEVVNEVWFILWVYGFVDGDYGF